MINLLPPNLKESYRYGRRNHTLRRWLLASGLGVLGAVLLTCGGLIVIRASTNNYQSQIASSTASLNKQNLTGVQQQVTTISNNLKLSVQVLSKEVLFSQLLKQLASVTPANVSLTDLAISQTQGAIDITAQTKDYNAATQLQVNLADPANQIFSKADLISITCTTSSSGSAGSNSQNYPCTAIYRALFANNNPFLFINNGTKAGS